MAEQHHHWGGWRQRVQQEREAIAGRSRSRSRSPRGGSAVQRPHSKLARSLLREWAWGTTAAPTVQKHAADAYSDGARHDMLRRLGRLGTGGQNPQNVHSQLMRMFKDRVGIKAITPLDASVQNCFIYPHDMFKMLWDLDPSAFKRRLCADKDKLFNFWSALLATPDGKRMARLHPHLKNKTAEDLRTTIPCSWHMDAGPVSKKQSAFALSWASILGLGSEREVRFLSSSWIKGSFPDLPEKVWEKLWESQEALADGVIPQGLEGAGSYLARDSDGTVWKCVFCSLLGDMECFQNDIGMRSYNYASMCAHCDANKSDLPFTELASSARWLRTRLTNPQFLASLRRPLHGLAAWPSFGYYYPRYDPLHVVDHKGVISKLWGSCVWSMVREPHLFGLVFPACVNANRTLRIETVSAHLKEWDRTHKTASRLPKLTVRSFFGDDKSTGWAALQGPGVKAAGERQCLPWLVAICMLFSSVDKSLFAQRRTKAAQALLNWSQLLYGCGVVLTEDEFCRQRRLALRFLRTYAWLAHNAVCDGRMEFQVVPKFHYFHEMSFQARLLNPRYQQTYQGESMVGRVAAIYKRSLAGPHSATVQMSVLRKYALGFEIELAEL